MRTFAIVWGVVFCFWAFVTRSVFVSDPGVAIIGNALLTTFLCIPTFIGCLAFMRSNAPPVTQSRQAMPEAPPVSKPSEAPKSLDHELFNWTKRDAYTLRDLHASVAIFGQVGSGKSSGSGLRYARAVTKLPGSGGLILASKPQDREFWVKRFAEQGRTDDLLIFDTSGQYKFNFLDFIRKSGGDSREITRFLTITAENLEGSTSKDGDPYWSQNQERLIFYAVEALRLGEGEVTIPKLQEFIATAAQAPTVFSDPEQYGRWKKLFNNQVMEKADAKAKTPIEKHDFESAIAYWTKEYPAMDNRPRSSILAGVMNTLATYNRGIVRDLVSNTSNVSPLDMELGKWVLVDLPIDQYGNSGRIIMSGWKLSLQQYILKRHGNPGDATICIFADECQQVVNSMDGDFLSRCRSHYGCMIYLTQSLHSYFGEAHGQAGEHKAKALLTNFKTKIFHTLGDHDTAQYASSLVGQRREEFISFSSGGERGGSGNFSEQYQDVLKPVDLLTGLRTSGGIVDGWVIKSGEPFSNGDNHLRIEFSQS
jgi:hypothetical protein